uniref:Uncharacterized protein n=1 Tax=Arundo donax TaxID=35708 RepID=A0A0A9G112_ARUDO
MCIMSAGLKRASRLKMTRTFSVLQMHYQVYIQQIVQQAIKIADH